ncbi:GTP-binding protein [Babesia microti strain RI]|uniref:GTP-binding protein n=1 Tax=Babesia microti (strain RI) TaxID=1133968 RepID=A0A1R4AA06_BABMR|nr:GTP-binding protein [Babesia microti strain RI]SJK85807.1 GTP-binding protein [Babesia microti strain RI]|eukprot:XP_021338026.1 GTP-binding protein [Babesia microti strain RI]
MIIPYLARPYVNIYVPNTNSVPIWLSDNVQLFVKRLFMKQVVPQPIYVSETIDYMKVTKIPQISLMGMSNCGKSSLINSLIHNVPLEHPLQKHMSNAKMLNMPTYAPVSDKPGRTRHLFTFNLDNSLSIVDLPGYGFAKGQFKTLNTWNKLIEKYLSRATNLKRILSLVDSRKGITELDIELWEMLKSYKIPFHVIFTKVDMLTSVELHNLNGTAIELLRGYSSCVFNYLNCTSSKNMLGILELKCTIAHLVHEERCKNNILNN